MSNDAINHTVKLTVRDGTYYLTLDFQGLKINDSYGYLSGMKYFLTGYTVDPYGNPQGELADVTIDSYQLNADGTRVSDIYGTDYPDKVTFEMIPEALEEGYVPLQVFVPLMDAIASGTGTQSVYLKLDWSSIKETTADDPGFEGDAGNGGGNNQSGGSGLSGGASLNGGLGLNGGSGLNSSGLNSSGLGGASLNSAVKTGDVSAAETWTAALVLAGILLAAAVLKKRNRR